jgi:hypothetical protein
MRGYGFCQGLDKWEGGREREAFAGENSSFFPTCARPGEEEEAQCCLKRHHFVLLFFF